MPEIKYSQEFWDQQREVNAIHKDVATAYGIIRDGLTRYKKKMLHARSKQQTEDLSIFAELDGYKNKSDIQDAYGWDMISYNQMERLNDLWEVREQVIANQGRFSDRVTEMLEHAMANCGDIFSDVLDEFDEFVRHDKERVTQIERANSTNNDNRYKAEL